MDTDSNNRSYFEALRQQSGNNDPQVQKIVQLLTMLVRGQSGDRQMSSETLSGIVSAVGSALASAVGGNPNFASQRYDTFYSALRDSGPIHMYGRANNEAGNMVYYGAANRPGNVTSNMAYSLTGYINDFSSRGEHGITGHEQRSMMTELMSARIRKNGMRSSLIDFGKNGTAAELQRAYSQNVDVIGGVGTAQGDEMQDVIRARKLMNRKAFDALEGRIGKGALGEFDANKEYWATKEFQGAAMAEDRKKIEADILKNGIKDDKTGRTIDGRAASMAVRQSHGGFSSNVANISDVGAMAEELRPAMEALVKIQKQTGKTFAELNGFASQLHMGSLANEKGLSSMKSFMDRMNEIAGSTGRNVHEVFAEAQNISDQMGPLASKATVARVQQRIAQSVNDQNTAGENTVYGVQATAQMAVQQSNALMGKNSGRALLRYALATTGVSGEARKQYEDLLGRMNNASSDDEMKKYNKKARKLLAANGLDVTDTALVNNATRTYGEEGDIDQLSDMALKRNASDLAGGKKGRMMTQALFGDTSKSSVDKAAKILYNLHDAIGSDDDGSKFNKLRELSKQLKGLGADEKAAKLKAIGESGAYSEYELQAISDLSDMSDEQLMKTQNVYGTYSRGMSQHTAMSKSDRAKAKKAASDAAINKRIDESVVGEEQKVGALDAFMNGAFGDAQLSEYDTTRGLMAQAEEHRNKLIAEAQSDDEKEKYKNMPIPELLNLANKGLNVGGFNDENIKQFKGAIENGKLTKSFKDTLLGDDAFMNKVGGKEKFGKMTDEEMLKAYENFHGGNIHFDMNTGNALFFNREAVDKANSVKQALRSSEAGKAALKAYGNADTAAENVKFDHEGKLAFLNVVTDHKERQLERGEHGELKARSGSGKDKGSADATLVKRSIDINELFGKHGGAEAYANGGKAEILRRLGLTGDEAKDKNGNKIDIESFFTKGDDGSYTGLSASGVEYLSKQAAKFDQDRANSSIPPELMEAVNQIVGQMEGVSTHLSGVIKGDAVRTVQEH